MSDDTRFDTTRVVLGQLVLTWGIGSGCSLTGGVERFVSFEAWSSAMQNRYRCIAATGRYSTLRIRPRAARRVWARRIAPRRNVYLMPRIRHFLAVLRHPRAKSSAHTQAQLCTDGNNAFKNGGKTARTFSSILITMKRGMHLTMPFACLNRYLAQPKISSGERSHEEITGSRVATCGGL